MTFLLLLSLLLFTTIDSKILIKNTDFIQQNATVSNTKSTDQRLSSSQDSGYIQLTADFGYTVEIQDLSVQDLQNLEQNSHRYIYHNSHGLLNKVTYLNNPLFQYQLSPSGDQVAFSFSIGGSGQGDVMIYVFSPESSLVNQLYQNNQRTSNFFWVDEQTLAINYNCGTGCLLQYVYDVPSGEKIDDKLERFLWKI